MKTMASLALAALISFAAAPKLAGADKKMNPAPSYEVATESTVVVLIADIREVPKTDPLGGVHLTVKSKGDTLDVYVAPAEFVKIFDITFKKGQEIEVTGSKVKFGGEDVILAREIQVDRTTLVLREKDGTPLWQGWITKEPLPTGY